ncbi:protein indeterminate-domain 12-like [Glycine soja]|nr:protein indeterminate-domain 12-like [Glycine soja]
MDEIHVTDPNAEVIALSPTTLMATNRFVCEICNKGFQRNQNLQLHRRGRNPPWKLRQRGSNELMKKRVYVCPEPSCVHHNPARALGDSTGIKKITADNMVKRNGSVTNALEDMLSNLTGRPTRKHVALGNTNVIGEPYFPR